MTDEMRYYYETEMTVWTQMLHTEEVEFEDDPKGSTSDTSDVA